MKAIRTVHLIGLGAIGTMYASLLHDSDPTLLTVVADRARQARYAAAGIRVNDSSYTFTMRDPAEIDEPADLLIVSVKQHQLDQAIVDAARSVGERTVVLSLLNGISSEEVIGAVYGVEKLLYAFCVETDATRAEGSVTFTKIGTVVFGERENEPHSERVQAVETLLEDAGMPTRVPRDMIRELWWKFMMNVGINPLSAVLGAPYGVFQEVPEARELFATAAREAVVLARSAGVELSEEDIDRCLGVFSTLSPLGKTSMLQDVEAHRKTEVEIFSGTVVALGRRAGVPTPVNEMLFRMVRTLEKSYGAA